MGAGYNFAPWDYAAGMAAPSIKGDVFHRVVLAIPGPEFQFVDENRGGNECVSQLNVMAFRILPQIVSRPLPDLDVDRNAIDRHKERIKSRMFPRPGAMPELRNGHRRT